MNETRLDRLEREVEQARLRVATDLARLRGVDPASLKDEIIAEVSDTARDAVRDRTESVIDEIKARIAANPGATMAVAAGLAWRLYRHPPVATVLVGAGLVGLLRTDPGRPAAGAGFARRAARQAAELAEASQESLHDLAEAGERAQRSAGEYAESARQQLREWGSEASAAAGEARARAGSAAAWMHDSGRRALGAADRDTYLLGAAALALAAAIGITAQRRLTDGE